MFPHSFVFSEVTSRQVFYPSVVWKKCPIFNIRSSFLEALEVYLIKTLQNMYDVVSHIPLHCMYWVCVSVYVDAKKKKRFCEWLLPISNSRWSCRKLSDRTRCTAGGNCVCLQRLTDGWYCWCNTPGLCFVKPDLTLATWLDDAGSINICSLQNCSADDTL